MKQHIVLVDHLFDGHTRVMYIFKSEDGKEFRTGLEITPKTTHEEIAKMLEAQSKDVLSWAK